MVKLHPVSFLIDGVAFPANGYLSAGVWLLYFWVFNSFGLLRFAFVFLFLELCCLPYGYYLVVLVFGFFVDHVFILSDFFIFN